MLYLLRISQPDNSFLTSRRCKVRRAKRLVSLHLLDSLKFARGGGLEKRIGLLVSGASAGNKVSDEFAGPCAVLLTVLLTRGVGAGEAAEAEEEFRT